MALAVLLSLALAALSYGLFVFALRRVDRFLGESGATPFYPYPAIRELHQRVAAEAAQAAEAADDAQPWHGLAQLFHVERELDEIVVDLLLIRRGGTMHPATARLAAPATPILDRAIEGSLRQWADSAAVVDLELEESNRSRLSMRQGDMGLRLEVAALSA